MGTGRNTGLSVTLAIVIVLVLAVAALSGIYFATPNFSHRTGSNEISVEALSFNISSSDLSSTVNVNSKSPLVRMDLYVNDTLLGYCNFTWSGSTMMWNGIPQTTRNWNNGTYSIIFSVSPQYFPRMSQFSMMDGALYNIEMIAHFQNGATYTVDRGVYVNSNGFSGMMGGGSSWQGMMGRYFPVQNVSIRNVISDMNNPPSNANIIKSNDTIVFSETQNVTILAVGMMPDKATNLTGMNPPSYASDDAFVIYGLIDPTLVIPSGAHINLIFANFDDDMYHNFVVTSLVPPYYYMLMKGMMFSNSSTWFGGGMGSFESRSNPIFGTTMSLLSPANYSQGTAYYYTSTFSLQSYSSNYWYICSYPGHAQSGMYGRILVTS